MPVRKAIAEKEKLYKLNGAAGVKTGLGITLRVMSGDVVDIFGKSFYHSGGATPNNSYPVSGALLNLLDVFAGSAAVTATHTGLTGTVLNSNPGVTGPLGSWLNGAAHDPASGDIPKAFINWVFLDEQFNPVTTTISGCDAVSSHNNVLKNHHQAVNITKNGYLYIYCSNESDMDVFFDNLQVIQTHGPLVEETHYYPFGLTMAGISSQALNFGQPENNKLYNKGSELQHKEFSDGSGLELYSTNFRSLDPQLGRWWQIDPKPDMGMSPYSAMDNNPILHNDPLGDTVNLSGLYVSKDGEAAKNKIIADLSAQTGLTLSEDDQGNLQYKTTKDKNGNDVAVIAKNKKGKNIGSATARNLITGAISDKRTVSVGVNNAGTGSKTSGLNIFLDTKQIDGFINGASRNLNPKTLGFGMTFMHELLHTDMEGALSDDKTAFGQTGAVVDKMNIIRSELGADYGQRLSYQGTYFNTTTKLPYYIPFDSNSFTDLSNGNTPNGNDMYVEVK